MNIPLIDLKTQYLNIKNEIDAAFRDIFNRSAFISGKYVDLFEKEFTQLQDAKYFLGLSSGTDAVHLMVWGSEIGFGDEVLVPVNTYIATAEGISMCGATPIFVDIDPNSFNININHIGEKISKKTKAIVPVHLYGQAAEMDPILELAKAHNLIVLEDSCQAHIADYKGKKVGNFGKASAFSFYPGKNLGAYGEAGGISTNDADFYQLLQKMRGHGSVQRNIHDVIGHNYRMSEFQAAVLYIKSKYLRDWTNQRRNIAKLYKSFLKDIEEIECPQEYPEKLHVYHLFVIKVGSGKRDKLQEYLEQNGISTGLHYPVPIHLQKAYQHLGHRRGDFPEAEKIADQILSLPIYPEMERDKVEYVCEKIRGFFV